MIIKTQSEILVNTNKIIFIQKRRNYNNNMFDIYADYGNEEYDIDLGAYSSVERCAEVFERLRIALVADKEYFEMPSDDLPF